MFKNKLLKVVVLTALVLSTTVISVSAVSSIFKEANMFQVAEKSGDINQVIATEDFRYTHFEPETSLALQGDEGTSLSPKVNIYNKMLNSIDYFNNLVLTMETSMLNDGITTVEYQIDINSNVAYQSVIEDEQITSETYSQAGNMILVDNLERTYMQNYLPTYTRSDTPYIPLESRITTGEDGIPCYFYRRNVTNCPLASYSVFPQEITYSYLKDFDKWKIEDNNATYLGRDCVKIVGTPAPYIAEKHSIDSFTMFVDSDTGILLYFQGTLSGNVSRYMRVIECSFETKAPIKQFNLADYDGYSEVQRW